MAKKKTAFVCQDCGYDTVKWLGRCPGCGAWNTMVEETIALASSSGLRLGLSMSSKPESIENIKIECTTLGEDPIVVADTKEDEETLKKCFYVKLLEHRCSKCNRLLGKFNGQAEIKCPKCGEINRIGVE